MKQKIVFLMITFAVSGCAFEKVQPWDRGDLARPEMSAEPVFLEATMRDHTYVSKEAASGGGALAGGGCGCN
jgi:hypothetical protein